MNAIGGAAVDVEVTESLEQAVDPNVVWRVEPQLDMAVDQPDGEILIVPSAKVR